MAGKFASKYGDNILRFVGKNIDTVAKAARKATDAVVGVGKKIVNGVSDILGKVFKHGDEAIEAVAEYSDEVSDVVKRCTEGNCFIAGTLVLTSDGYKKIEDVKVGDKVIATDPETGETTEKEVVETYIRESDELVHIFVNGEKIVTTPTHPFYVPEIGWTDAADLRAGDMLVLVNGEYVVIERIEHEILEDSVTVYNFQVADFHTYHVGEQGVLVHNTCFRKKLQELTGKAGDGADAHHVLPQKFDDEFLSLGIDNHNPKYGSWVESHLHSSFSREYNEEWYSFLYDDNGLLSQHSKSEVEEFARMLAGKFGFEINF